MGGEVDLSTVAVLQAGLNDILGRRPAHVVVDLVELRFCSVRGLAVLAQAATTAAGQGTEYAIGGASRQVNRVWTLGWQDTELPMRFPTASDAVLAALAHQAGRAEGADRVRPRPGWAPKHLYQAAPPSLGGAAGTPAACAG